MASGGISIELSWVRLPDVLPVIIAVFGGEPRRFDERLKQHGRAADDIAQDPRDDNDQVLYVARRRSRLKSQAGLGFLCQQIPTFQFKSHERFVAGDFFESNVREGLRLANEAIQCVAAIRIPSRCESN